MKEKDIGILVGAVLAGLCVVLAFGIFFFHWQGHKDTQVVTPEVPKKVDVISKEMEKQVDV